SLESLNAEIDQLDEKRRRAGVDQPLGGFTQNLRGFESYSDAGAIIPVPGSDAPIYSMDDGKTRARLADQAAATEARRHALAMQYKEEELKSEDRIREAALHGAPLVAQQQKDAHAENLAAQQTELANELYQQKALQKNRDLQIEMGEKDPNKLVDVPFVPANAGEEQRRHADQAADAKAFEQRKELGEESALAIMKADDATAQARLQGEALYFRKMQDDIRETTRELIDQGRAAEIPSRIREINEKYFDDLGERAVKAAAAGAAAARRAQAGGLTGAASIEAEFDAQINKNNTELAENPDAQHDANVAAAKERDQKLLELQTTFSQRMSGIGETWVNSSLDGYSRIEAEAKKASDQIEEEFTKTYGGPGVDTSSDDYKNAQQARSDALAGVKAGARAKERELDASNRAEDLRYDQEASQAEMRIRETGLTGWVDRYRSAAAEIRDQEEQRLAQLARDAQREGLTEEEI